jgi:ubiquinone/menaquinone biosynthesis C-methylase UbiE
MSDPVLPFTGERFTPECLREIAYEHWHRYAFALPFAKGRRVLDAACGEGFGSAALAGGAAQVLGIDIDAETLAHARVRYGQAVNLRFDRADATALEHLPAASFDLIVSFETLEHVHEQERMLDGFARLLAPDGLLMVSTPDKRTYTDATGTINPHHVRELYREEFEALLAPRFPHMRLFGQKLAFVSMLRRLDGQGARDFLHTALQDGERFGAALDFPSMYYLAVCGRSPLPDSLPAMSLFSDAEESVYSHYYQEIRRAMALERRVSELEGELERFQRNAARSSMLPPFPDAES